MKDSDPIDRLNASIRALEYGEASRTPARQKLDAAAATLGQSKIVQLTALVAAVGAIITSLIVAFKPDNSKDLAAYEKMEAMYEAVRKDAIRQNHDNATTRTEIGRLDDEKTREFEEMRVDLDELRKKIRLPLDPAPPPPEPQTPKLPPVVPVMLPKHLDDVPPLAPP